MLEILEVKMRPSDIEDLKKNIQEGRIVCVLTKHRKVIGEITSTLYSQGSLCMVSSVETGGLVVSRNKEAASQREDLLGYFGPDTLLGARCNIVLAASYDEFLQKLKLVEVINKNAEGIVYQYFSEIRGYLEEIAL